MLKVARSTHLIIDLLDVCHHMWNVKFEKYKKVSFFTDHVRVATSMATTRKMKKH